MWQTLLDKFPLLHTRLSQEMQFWRTKHQCSPIWGSSPKTRVIIDQNALSHDPDGSVGSVTPWFGYEVCLLGE